MYICGLAKQSCVLPASPLLDENAVVLGMPGLSAPLSPPIATAALATIVATHCRCRRRRIR